jgi:hypothetical protein
MDIQHQKKFTEDLNELRSNYGLHFVGAVYQDSWDNQVSRGSSTAHDPHFAHNDEMEAVKQGLSRLLENMREPDPMLFSRKEAGLLAFCLFTTGMRMGPDVFETLESIARKCCITAELKIYAQDWKYYADTVRRADKVAKDLFQKPNNTQTPQS